MEIEENKAGGEGATDLNAQGGEGTTDSGNLDNVTKDVTKSKKSKGKVLKVVEGEEGMFIENVNPDWVQPFFDHNPTVDVLYGTHDEQAFVGIGDARNHARFLDVKDVKTFNR